MKRWMILAWLALAGVASAQVPQETLRRSLTTGAISGSNAGAPFQVATIAALRAAPVTGLVTGAEASTAGYYAANDGGQGTYVWNSSSTATDNGGSVIQATGVTTGRWILQSSGVVNVLQFGADRNGSVDSITAIENADAYAGSGTVYFPTGTYLLSAPITITTNTSWLGESKQGSIIRGMSSVLIPAFGNMLLWSGTTGATIQNLTLDANQPAPVLWTTGSNYSLGQYVYDVVTAVTTMYQVGVAITNSTTHPASDPTHFNPTGVQTVIGPVNGAVRFAVKNCFVINFPMIGIGAGNTTIFEFSGNDIACSSLSNGGYINNCIFTTDAGGACSDGRILNNRCANAPIYVDCKRCLVKGNYINGFAYGAGIATDADSTDSNDVIIEGNWITGGVGTDVNGDDCQGMELYAPNSTVTGNVCWNNSGNGIYCAGRNHTITGNVCYNNNQSKHTTNSGITLNYVSAGPYTADQSTCTGNVCYDNQGTPTQNWGILVGSGVDNAQVSGNSCWGNVNGSFLDGGTQTNNFITITGAAVSLTTATPANVCSVTLLAGVYDVAANTYFTLGSGTTITYLEMGLNITSATLPATQNQTGVAFPTGNAPTTSIPTGLTLQTARIVIPSGGATLYLVAQAGFGVSTLTVGGSFTVKPAF